MNRYNTAPREAALAASESLEIQSTGLVEYRAGRELLVIAGDNPPQRILALPSALNTRILVRANPENGGGASLIGVAGATLRVQGYLGAFEVRIDRGDGRTELLRSDMVLDLTREPLIGAVLKPPGYLHSDAGQGALRRALTSLEELTGVFDKPQFFQYDAAICAHRRNGITACTRCIDACPAEAITSLAERIQVDPFLCQGGGVCATVCPSGAIRYAYPSPGDLGSRLRLMLRRFKEAGGEGPEVLLHDQEHPCTEMLAACPSLLPLALEELGSVGPEIWLAALAYGARRVLLHDHGELSRQVYEAIDGQLGITGRILSGLGYPAGAVTWVQDDEPPVDGAGAMPPITATPQAAMEEKRNAFYMALDHLYGESERPRPMVELPAGSPFGSAGVDANRCTLCMACASVCPANALQDGQGQPRLRFRESNCIQCGLCTRSCPEDAIWITPRLLLDRQQRERVQVLHEEEPFCCINCGKPFATRSVINNMLQRLSGHWMFQEKRARQRLRMCEACRVVDVVQDPQVMNEGGFTRQ